MNDANETATLDLALEFEPNRILVTTSEWKATIVLRPFDERRSWSAATRIFGAFNVFAPAEEAAIHVNACSPAWGEGDGFTDETRAAHMKEYRALKAAAIKVAKPGLAAAIKSMNVITEMNAGKFRFSVMAGCSMCACSPGFISEHRFTVGNRPIDIHFDAVTKESN